MFLQLIILTIGLSLDAFGIGISYGIRKISLHPVSVVIISAISIIFSTFSILLGNIISKLLSENLTKYISILLLFFMGFGIIINTLIPKKQNNNFKKDSRNLFIQNLIKLLGITINTMKKPEVCDLNNSLKIEPKEAIYLGIALSIDSVGIGFAIYSLNYYSYLFPVFIMFFQLAFLSLGILLGKYLKCISANEKFWSIVSGFILIFISLTRLVIN